MFHKRLLASLAIPVVVGAAPTLPSGEHKDIIGGTPAGTNEFPFLVSLQDSKGHFCGGTLINADTVVTAAHCTYGPEVSSIAVRAGSMHWTTGGVLVPVREIIVRPGFDIANLNGDIAIFKLSTPIPASPAIGYATLAQRHFRPPPRTILTAAGWGVLNEHDSTFPDMLYKVDVPVIDKKKCQKHYSKDVVTDVQFCALAPEGGKDACKGDSGGPIVDSDKTFIGISSWGKECGSPEFPGVYTNIGSFHHFIRKHEND